MDKHNSNFSIVFSKFIFIIIEKTLIIIIIITTIFFRNYIYKFFADFITIKMNNSGV